MKKNLHISMMKEIDLILNRNGEEFAERILAHAVVLERMLHEKRASNQRRKPELQLTATSKLYNFADIAQ